MERVVLGEGDRQAAREANGSAEPQAYDRTTETIDNLAARAGDAGEVAQLVGEVLRAGRPRFLYRVGASAGLGAGLGRLVSTSMPRTFPLHVSARPSALRLGQHVRSSSHAMAGLP